jgi:hypothetical protein
MMTYVEETLFGEAPAAAPKAITIKQPYASLIMAGIKPVENRTWNTSYRGTLLIHAGKGVVRDAMDAHGDLVGDYPAGAIIGTVELVDVVTDSASPWAMEGHYHWILASPRPCTPVPADGKLSLWAPTAEAWSAVEGTLA